MIKRILLGIGGTPFTPVAMEYAVEIASRTGARITAVTVLDAGAICKLGPVPAGAGYYADRMCKTRMERTKQQIDEALATFERNCSRSGVGCQVEWESGDPFELMTSHARYHDLVIFGLRSIFEYQLVEEPEKTLIHMLSQGIRPILAVSDHFQPIRRVMVAYSGSMESAKAMKHFVQFNLWPDVALEIVHFSERPDASHDVLKNAAEYCQDYGYTVSTRIIAGKARELLMPTAKERNADLVVMGNSIRSIWMRKVLGDNLLAALNQADRPLFLSQ